MGREGRTDEFMATDESDSFVALVRSAIILAVLMLPWIVPEGRETPKLMHLATIVAAVYTLALFVARLGKRSLPLQRQLAITVDLFLITAAIMTWRDASRELFQLYYIVVIVAAMWFGRGGALVTAVLAIGAFVLGEYAVAQSPIVELALIEMLWENGALVLVILALASSYVLRARDIERAYRWQIDHELRLARSLQREMLPAELPRLPGYDLAVRLEAAREVSGDLYDFIMLDEQTLLLFVVDVAGKSVHGLMHVSLLHSHLRAAAAERIAPAAIAEWVNKSVYDALQPHNFASAFIAHLHLPSGRLVFVNCGHPPPLLLREGGVRNVQRLQTGTTMIGITRTPGYLQLSTHLRPGDALVITTDGVLEARDPRGDFFGEHNLLATLASAEGDSAEEIAAGVMSAVTEFSGGPVSDDAIVTALKRMAGNGHLEAVRTAQPLE